MTDFYQTIKSRFKAELGARGVAILSSAILYIFLASFLDPGGYGLLFLAITVAQVTRLLGELGIAKSGARYLSEFSETDRGQIRHVLRLTATYQGILLSVVSAGLFAFRTQIAAAIGEPSLEPYLAIATVFVFVSGAQQYFRYMFQGVQQIRTSALLNAVNGITRLAFVTALVLLGFGGIGALVGYTISAVVVVCLGTVYLLRLRSDNPSASEPEPGLGRRILAYNVPISLTKSANVLQKRIDVLLIGYFLTPVAVGYYTISKQIVEFIEAPATALGFTMSPVYGTHKSTGETDRAGDIYETTFVHTMLLYVPAGAGLLLVADPLVQNIFGSEYAGAVVVLQVFSLFVVLQGITQITSDALDFVGRAKSRAIVKGVSAVLNALLNVILIPIIGVTGAAIATVVAYSLYAGANIYIIHDEFTLRVGYLVRQTTVILGITAVMSVAVAIVSPLISGLVTLMAAVLFGVIVWFVLSLTTGFLEIAQIRGALGRTG